MKTCKLCGADITGRHPRARYCLDCSRAIDKERGKAKKATNKQRTCNLCGADISDRGSSALYCLECAKLQREKSIKEHIQKRQKLKNAPDRVDRKQCKTCVYRGWNQEYACNYIAITGQMRGCPPSPNCTRYQKGKRIQKEWKLEVFNGKIDSGI